METKPEIKYVVYVNNETDNRIALKLVSAKTNGSSPHIMVKTFKGVLAQLPKNGEKIIILNIPPDHHIRKFLQTGGQIDTWLDHEKHSDAWPKSLKRILNPRWKKPPVLSFYDEKNDECTDPNDYDKIVVQTRS